MRHSAITPPSPATWPTYRTAGNGRYSGTKRRAPLRARTRALCGCGPGEIRKHVFGTPNSRGARISLHRVGGSPDALRKAMEHPDRRFFLKKMALCSAGIMIVPRHVLGGNGYT